MFLLYAFLLSFFMASGQMTSSHPTTTREVTLEQLQAMVGASGQTTPSRPTTTNDTLYVINFWATWCKPCVAEMPYFQQAATKFANQKVKVVFVSLNYPREISVIDKFAKQHKITQECYVLNAGNPNVWIDKIEKEWGGSIPATIMYKGGKKVFFREGEFSQTELDSIIQTKNK